MADDSIKSLIRRYHDGLVVRTLWLVNLSMLGNGVLACLIMWKALYPDEAAYYTTVADSRATRIVATSMPNQSDMAILDWASMAVIAASTYNWTNWQDQLNTNVRPFFSQEGWDQFYSAVAGSATIANVTTKQLRTSAVVSMRPTILSKGIINGSYSWKVDVPVLVTYESPGETKNELLIVRLLIARISPGESKSGIGIMQYFASPIGSIT